MLHTRRDFLSRSALLAGAATFASSSSSSFGAPAAGKFKLRFGPHPGMFKAHAGDDVIDQIKFAADQGFTAWEDNGLPGRPPAEQEKIGKALADLGMTMGVFVRHSDQAYAICRAVDSPSCKILFDIYHQQVTEGNLIPNIDQCWNEIGYCQCGDNPGRKEPGTGEINYAKVFGHIAKMSAEAGREFVIGMEHGSSKGGKERELAVIEAYRKVDPS